MQISNLNFLSKFRNFLFPLKDPKKPPQISLIPIPAPTQHLQIKTSKFPSQKSLTQKRKKKKTTITKISPSFSRINDRSYPPPDFRSPKNPFQVVAHDEKKKPKQIKKKTTCPRLRKLHTH